MNRLRTRTFASALIALFALPVLAAAFASPAEASPYGRSYYRHGGGFYNGGQRYYLRSGRLRADAKARVNGNRYQGRVHQYYDARNNYRYERNLRFGGGARAVPHRGFGYSNYRYSTPSVGSSKYRGYGHGHEAVRLLEVPGRRQLGPPQLLEVPRPLKRRRAAPTPRARTLRGS